MKEFKIGECYCNYPNPTEDKLKCKLCGGNNPKIIESKIKKVKK